MTAKFPTTLKEIKALPDEDQLTALEKAVIYHNKK